MSQKVIQIGDEGQLASRDMVRRFDSFAERHPEMELEALRGQLRALEAIDRQYGGHSPLPLEDVEALVGAAVTALAHLDRDARAASPEAADTEIADLAIGVALWASRHGVELAVVEPVANALAMRSNRARSRSDLAAVFGLMQGVIAHVAPRLAADLERSNPERPWRILHANLAITAIRTEDPDLIDYAFDALDRALPDERAAFYAEALALALSPRVAPGVRRRIEARHRQWAGDLS
jgi:hypothetical protein